MVMNERRIELTANSGPGYIAHQFGLVHSLMAAALCHSVFVTTYRWRKSKESPARPRDPEKSITAMGSFR